MSEILYDVDIHAEYDGDTRPLSVSIFSHQPTLIDVCSQDGGSSLSVVEARQLIAALQKAIEIVEAIG